MPHSSASAELLYTTPFSWRCQRRARGRAHSTARRWRRRIKCSTTVSAEICCSARCGGQCKQADEHRRPPGTSFDISCADSSRALVDIPGRYNCITDHRVLNDTVLLPAGPVLSTPPVPDLPVRSPSDFSPSALIASAPALSAINARTPAAAPHVQRFASHPPRIPAKVAPTSEVIDAATDKPRGFILMLS